LPSKVIHQEIILLKENKYQISALKGETFEINKIHDNLDLNKKFIPKVLMLDLTTNAMYYFLFKTLNPLLDVVFPFLMDPEAVKNPANLAIFMVLICQSIPYKCII